MLIPHLVVPCSHHLVVTLTHHLVVLVHPISHLVVLVHSISHMVVHVVLHLLTVDLVHAAKHLVTHLVLTLVLTLVLPHHVLLLLLSLVELVRLAVAHLVNVDMVLIDGLLIGVGEPGLRLSLPPEKGVTCSDGLETSMVPRVNAVDRAGVDDGMMDIVAREETIGAKWKADMGLG